MAILILGTTACGICGRVIESRDEVVGMPAFAFSERDPLILFNDASFHAPCFESNPLRARVDAVLEELRRKSGPGNRACAVCGEQVLDANDYLMIPRLVDDAENPVARFKYTHLHRSHIHMWSEREAALAALRGFERENGESASVSAIIRELAP